MNDLNGISMWIMNYSIRLDISFILELFCVTIMMGALVLVSQIDCFFTEFTIMILLLSETKTYLFTQNLNEWMNGVLGHDSAL